MACAWPLQGCCKSPLPLPCRAGERDPARQPQPLHFYRDGSRLSFLLWNSTPDDQLIDVAERGDLVDPVKLQQETLRMLAKPRSRIAIQDFFSQYLDLGRLQEVERDPNLYPGYNSTLPKAMETEVRLLVDDLVFRSKGDIRDLFTEPRGYVNRLWLSSTVSKPPALPRLLSFRSTSQAKVRVPVS